MRLIDADYLIKCLKAKPPIGDVGRITLEECIQEVYHQPTVDISKLNGEDKQNR